MQIKGSNWSRLFGLLVLVACLFLVPKLWHGSVPKKAGSRPAVVSPTKATSSPTPGQTVSPSMPPIPQVSAIGPPTPAPMAEADASLFLDSYLSYLYNGAPLSSVLNVDQSVRARLSSTLLSVTQGRHYTITYQGLFVQDATNVQVDDTISEGGLARYSLAYTMALQGTVWNVNTLPVFDTQ